MKIKYLMAAFSAIAFSMHSVWAADNDVQKQNIARLAVLYDAYKTDKLVAFLPEASDIKLLEDHIIVLNVEKDKLGRFVHRNVIPGLYRTGGFASGALFGSSAVGSGILGYATLAAYNTHSSFSFFQAVKEAVVGYSQSGKLIRPRERLTALVLLSMPLLTLITGVGMEKFFRWAYQYNQKRAEWLQAIEENLKMDQEILIQLKK